VESKKFPVLQPRPQYVPCDDCGEFVPLAGIDEHVCAPDDQLDYQMLRLRPGLLRLEADFRCWLQSRQGQFEIFYAECRRPAPALEPGLASSELVS
jgi:hypothetical protein